MNRALLAAIALGACTAPSRYVVEHPDGSDKDGTQLYACARDGDKYVCIDFRRVIEHIAKQQSEGGVEL